MVQGLPYWKLGFDNDMDDNDRMLVGDRMNDDECKEMNERFKHECYPHIVIFQLQKIPYDKCPRNVYYRLSRELWEDLELWLQNQDDCYKL